MAKYIHNKTVTVKTYQGREVLANSYFEIQSNLYGEFAADSALLSDIGSGECSMSSDGVLDCSSVADSIRLLVDGSIKEVITQFERQDLSLKICSNQAEVDGNGEALVEILVPGTFNGVTIFESNGRYISGGETWFDSQHKDDRITEVSVVDKDNILGYGANTVIKTYHDTEAAESLRGWRIPMKYGHIYAETLGFYGFIPSGLYVAIKGKKGGNITTGTLYLNIEWGIHD